MHLGSQTSRHCIARAFHCQALPFLLRLPRATSAEELALRIGIEFRLKSLHSGILRHRGRYCSRSGAHLWWQRGRRISRIGSSVSFDPALHFGSGVDAFYNRADPRLNSSTIEPAGTELKIGSLPKRIPIRASAVTVRKQQQRSQGSIALANRSLDAISVGLSEDNFEPGSIGSNRI